MVSLALVLGVAAFAAVIAGVATVFVLASRQAREDEAPPSRPDDFVAPVSSGGYRWRRTDESPEEFHARIARENAPPLAHRVP
jgi:hypothetical protein